MQVIAKNLTYSYGGKRGTLSVKALNDVTVTVKEGEFFGIVGRTGSGKSTFIQHINGLIKLQKNSGTVIVGEFDLSDKKTDFKVLRSKVGMVFQYPEYQLFAETVFADVAFGIKNFFPKLSDEKVADKVKQAIEKVGLNFENIKNKSPFELSGGQKRRVAIAGVIASKPEILVLDEPAAGLDPKGKSEFLRLLHELHGDFVKTIIIVSHDMNLISEHCTRAIIFSDGKIVKEGTPEEIFSFEKEVESLGLELPVVVYLKEKLFKCGKDIDSGLKIDDFVDAIAAKFGGKR